MKDRKKMQENLDEAENLNNSASNAEQGQDGKKKTGNRSLRIGGYSVLATLVVVAVLVAVNVLVSVLPSRYTEFDMTSSGMYELSDESIALAKSIDTEVTFYWIVTDGNESYSVETLLNRYVSYNSHIHVEKIDVSNNPTFLKQYELDAADDNSVLVVGNGKYRFITTDDIFVTTYVSSDTSSSGMEASVSFEGENAVTGALNYIVMTDCPLVCFTVGHGETSLDSTYTEDLEIMNVESQDLNVGARGAVPDECKTLVMVMPTSDITEDEADIILDYVATRGNFVLISLYQEEDMENQPNLKNLMARFGVSQGNGFIAESDPDYYYAGKSGGSGSSGGRMYIMPEMHLHSINYSIMSNKKSVLLPMSTPILVAEDLPEHITKVTSLLYTSDSAYCKTAGYSMTSLEKEAGDTDGPFNVGTLSTYYRGTGENGSVVWYSSPYVVDAATSKMVSGANETLFLNTISYLTDLDEGVAISGKTMDSDYLIVPASTALIMTIVIAVVIPLLLIIIGIVVTVRRRRR